MGCSRVFALTAVLTALAGCPDDGAGATEMATSTAGGSQPTTGPDTLIPELNTTGATSGDGPSGSGTSNMSSGTSSALEPCADGVQGPGETDVDCGGPTCAPCEDGRTCGADDDCASMACAGGICVAPECGADADCAALSGPCLAGACDQSTFSCVTQPIDEGLPCDDRDACTLGEHCTAGACAGGTPRDCSAFAAACNVGACDPKTGACVTAPDPNEDGQPCDDGHPCTPSTTCLAGQCGDPMHPGYVLHEEFAAPDPGWQLGQGWEVGPAVASPPGDGNTGSDPVDDHSPGDDGHLAGQFIGGLVTNDNVALGQFNCLTSPPVDTSKLPSVWLTFWRHLHADYMYFAVVHVDVWNGASWITVLEGYPQPVTNDMQWQEIDLELTEHKNPAMQVRFCHQRNNGAYFHGGWSLDDVTIGEIACTP